MTIPMKPQIPPELLEQIARESVPLYSIKKLQELAPYALVNKEFLAAFGRQLYRRIHLLPVGDNSDPGGPVIPSLQSIASNPVLGSYVHIFENWPKDEADIIDKMDSDTMESVVFPALDNMTNLHLILFTPTRMAEKLLRNLHSKQSSLSTIRIIGADPRKFIWDPFQVASSGSLKNLTTLHWTFIPGLYPNYRTGDFSLVIEQVCFLMAIVEISCPALKDLLLDAKSAYGFPRRAGSGNWKLDMGDLGWDIARIQDRTQRAKDGSEPCKLRNLRRLVLRFPENLSSWSKEEFSAYREWTQKFFAHSLAYLKDLEVGLTCLRTALNQSLITKLCSLAGPSLQKLTIRGCKDYCPLAHESHLDGAISMLRELSQELPSPDGTTFNLKETLQSLEIDQIHGTFDTELAEALQQWTALKTLRLGDDSGREGEDTGFIDGGWLSLEQYNLEENFISKLPSGLEVLQLDIQATEVSLQREDFKINGPLVFSNLPSLRSFHFVCSTQDDDACIPPWPENEVFIHRLSATPDPESKTQKRLSSTYLQMQYQHSHRLITHRGIEILDLEGEREFDGQDETDPWLYGEDEIDLILTCGQCDDELSHFIEPNSVGFIESGSDSDADDENDEDMSGVSGHE